MNTIDIKVKGSIRLAQFLKLANAVEDGAGAKIVVRSGDVEVNGTVEQRPGAQLQAGDLITYHSPNAELRFRVA
ncbi:MAG: RNA-binding S4 domain-containing protein [Actinomycetaceae bacterium]|nr:RNA-binding S4 domain-containing protein [Actinomycetaceae bacterium]